MVTNHLLLISCFFVLRALSFHLKVPIATRHHVIDMVADNHAGNTDATPKTPRPSIDTKSIMKFGLVGATSLIYNALDANADDPGTVVVIGSGGKTGKMIVENLSYMGIAVRPTNREGKANSAFKDLPSVTTMAVADVTKIGTLEAALSGASVVVFAASASSKGGNAKQVDYQGVENVAKECIRLKVPRLVVISSGAVTKPDSLGFKITNLFGGIMDLKLKGENSMKQLYAANGDSSLSYAVIRPGGLLDNAKVGAASIELNQGDTISGEVNRADVADCAANAAVSKTLPPAVTFEVYEAGKSGPLEGRYPSKSGYERNGGDYDTLFKGLKSGEL